MVTTCARLQSLVLGPGLLLVVNIATMPTCRIVNNVKAHSHCKLDWMHIQTDSRQCSFEQVQFAFLHSHYCKLTSVKSFSSHDHCASVAWRLEFEPCQRKWRFFLRSSISCQSVDLTLDILGAPYAHKSPVFLVIRPARNLYFVKSLCAHVSIDWFINVQITCISHHCRCKSTLNWIGTTSWSGLEAIRFESGLDRSTFGVNATNEHWTGLNAHWECSVNGPLLYPRAWLVCNSTAE